MILQESPTKIRLTGLPVAALRQHLSYVDKSVDFELAKARNSKWLLSELGEAGWREHLADLKAKRVQSLLFEDKQGYWTYSGLGWWLTNKFRTSFESKVSYPEPKLIPWERVPDKTPRPYQLEIRDQLLAARHGGVEVGTGLGKTLCLMLIAKELGLKTVVMTPSVSIAEQIFKEFEYHLGKSRVGQFFDGRKDSKKLFVVAVDDSLTRVEPDDPHWQALSQAQVFIADESHLCPAKSLAKVCTGLLAAAPYRFFFSGTQIRNDGLDLLLDAITGNIVYRMSVKEGVDQGWLAKPMFRIIKSSSENTYFSKDANAMTRKHLYYNPSVCAKAAEIANLMVEDLGRQVVVLVKELEQFAWLLPHFRHKVKFAHGGVNKENRGKVSAKYHESDPNELVKDFNAGKFPILVGTNCITTGTDIQTVGCIVYLQGGRSEIAVKQCIGRGTRKPLGKEDCFFVDFDVENVDIVHRHTEERVKIYQDVYPDFEELAL